MTKLGEIFLEKHALSQEELDRGLQAQKSHGGPLGLILTQLGLVSGEDLIGALATQFDLPIALRSDFPLAPLDHTPCSLRFLHANAVLPLGESDDEIRVALADPTKEFVEPAMTLAFDKPVSLYLAPEDILQEMLDQLYPLPGEDDPAESVAVPPFEGAETSGEDVELLRDLASDAPIIQAINQIITKAIGVGASDIHFEPSDREVVVRIRLDGILMEMDRFPIGKAPALLSRIKIMADLDIAERRLAQDGRFKFSARGVEIDTRVSIIPSLRGEGAVLRLLERRNVKLEFSALGMPAPVVSSLEGLLTAKQGMILITGPTGSGKTTSLYAAMKQLNAAERKIISVEDPVEYRVDGVTQIQVNPKIDMGFGNALRSILRHDPDVLVVGEMRDAETAEISVQSALTGHLVLTTLHTNNAATAVTRLLDMGVEPYLITSTCLGVLGQRLVRRICPSCKEAISPTDEMIEKHEATVTEPLTEARFSHGVGCEKCLGTGYSGRVGVYEFLTMDDTIRNMVLAQEDSHKIHHYAIEAGMISMWADGMSKVARGETTYEELMRVISGDDYGEI